MKIAKKIGRSLQAIRSFLPVNPYLSEAFGWKRKEWKLFRNVVQHLVAHAKRICAGGYNVSNAIIYRTGDGLLFQRNRLPEY